MNKIITIIVIILVIVGAAYVLFFYQKADQEKSPQDAVSEGKLGENTSKEGVFKEEETIDEFARYKIEFIAFWSNETHPGNYVKSAHFSPFVAYSHNNSEGAKIFTKGQIATAGIEDMAETGATTKLNQEIDMLIESNVAFKKTQGSVFDSPGSDSAELEVSRDYKYITFVSMVAPSPDWFVSATAGLLEDGKWLDKAEFELTTYDAGSDSGQTLTAADDDTRPKELVAIFNDNLQGLGKITLTRVK